MYRFLSFYFLLTYNADPGIYNFQIVQSVRCSHYNIILIGVSSAITTAVIEMSIISSLGCFHRNVVVAFTVGIVFLHNVCVLSNADMVKIISFGRHSPVLQCDCLKMLHIVAVISLRDMVSRVELLP